MNDLGLSLRHRAQLIFHNIAAKLGLDGLSSVHIVPKKLATGEDVFHLTMDGESMYLAGPLIWRSYRRGFANRKDRLALEFGLGAPFVVGNGDTVIDIGANMGDFALAAANMGANVFAFDGDPLVVACQRENLAHTNNVTISEAILWKASEEVTFYSAPDHADSSLFLPPGEGVAAFTAQARTLDEMAEDLGIQEVTLLKMDAEGAEPEVLMGASKVLARTQAVAIDTGPERNGEETHQACADILTAAGFTVMPQTGQLSRKITMARRTD